MTTLLWLVRHAATDWSDEGRLNGWTDVPLNHRGRLQARSLAERLDGRRFAGIWSSDLTRAVETARIAVGEPVLDPRLRELDFGALEGRRWEEIPDEARGALAAFEGFDAPEGESLAGLGSRVLRFLQALPDGKHLVFTHGGVLRLCLRETGADRQVLPGEIVRVPLEVARLADGIGEGSA